MAKSGISVDYEFDEKTWIVSVVNTGSRFAGHSVIIVEGIKKNSLSIHDSLFIGQYDIKATIDEESSSNKYGYINQVRCFEGSKFTRDYSQYPAKSYCVLATAAKTMIASIKRDKEECEKATKGEAEFRRYQHLGKSHLLADEGAGDNCATWCVEKLDIAGIEAYGTKPKQLAGQCRIL